jgi:hypothetical protein
MNSKAKKKTGLVEFVWATAKEFESGLIVVWNWALTEVVVQFDRLL